MAHVAEQVLEMSLLSLVFAMGRRMLLRIYSLSSPVISDAITTRSCRSIRGVGTDDARAKCNNRALHLLQMQKLHRTVASVFDAGTSSPCPFSRT